MTFIHPKNLKEMSENEVAFDDPALIDFWSTLNNNYTNQETYDNEIAFCKTKPFSLSTNCSPMCFLFQDCELNDIPPSCPFDFIKPLFISCCSAWEGDFECEIDSTITSFTNTTTSANITNINLSPTPALAVNVSTVHNKSPTETNTEALTSNESSSMPLETVSEFATVIEELEGTVNQTTSQNAKEDDNPLVYILIPFLFAVLVILGVFCIRTKIQRTKSKYAIMFRSFAISYSRRYL